MTVPRANSRSIEYRSLFLIFGLAFAARVISLLAVSWASPYRIGSDAVLYDALAQSLLRGDGFTYQGQATAFVVPGYPAFLAGIYALFGRDLVAVGMVQAILGAVSAVFIASTTARLAGPMAGRAAGVIVAFYPHFLIWTGFALTENLSLPLTAFALWALVRAEMEAHWRNYLLAGLALAAAVLARGNLVVFLPVAAVLALSHSKQRKRWSYATVLLLAAVAPLLPWVIRNAVVLGTPVLATEGGQVLWAAYNPRASELHANGYVYVEPLPEAVVPGGTELELSAQYARAGLAYLKTQPLAPLLHLPAKAWNMWRPVFAGAKLQTWVVFGVSYVSLIVLAVYGWTGTRNPSARIHAASRIPMWFVVVITASHLLMIAEVRYRMPIEMALAVFAGMGITLAAERWVSMKWFPTLNLRRAVVQSAK
jgi:4-amino-4-deoxy-L-arabinose transferase-like glycosyltransferase